MVIKVEGNERAVSHPSRNDRWLEDFDIPVEKANEVEITIYDTVGSEGAPIGMLWLRVSDLVEALRRQKVGQEGQGAGWVTAATAATLGQPQNHDNVTLGGGSLRRTDGGAGAGGGRLVDGRSTEGIDGWWSVEPAGAISMRLDFGMFSSFSFSFSLLLLDVSPSLL